MMITARHSLCLRDPRVRKLAIALLVLLYLTMSVSQAFAIRIKDVAHLQGIRDNQLFGIGLVIGLNGTGDGSSVDFTTQFLANYLRRNNIQITDPGSLKVENVAAVAVTAQLPAFSRRGDSIDVHVSSIGDAETLQGGTLLLTTLESAGQPGLVYALAQGAISIGGFTAGSGGNSVTKNHPTAGKVPGGATVEIDSPVQFDRRSELRYSLRAPDFTTAQRVAEVINANIADETAQALNAAEIIVQVPAGFADRLPEFIASIERLPVHPDQSARIVINERTGTVVIGEDVRISTLALAHGNLTIEITQDNRVSQPGAFSGGETTTQINTGVSAQEESDGLMVVNEGISLGELVSSLNAIGVTPLDLIAILQNIKRQGSLQAELIIN